MASWSASGREELAARGRPGSPMRPDAPRRRARAARPRRCPGDRRRRAALVAAVAAPCRPGRPAPGCAGRRGVSSVRAHGVDDGPRRPASKSRVRQRDARRSGSAGASRRRPSGPSITSKAVPVAGFQKRSLKRPWPRACSSAYASASAPCSRARSRHERSALYQSALISTGLPMRGVTTQSPTLASIQVSCTPGLAGAEQAVGRSTLDAVARARAGASSTISASTGNSVAQRVRGRRSRRRSARPPRRTRASRRPCCIPAARRVRESGSAACRGRRLAREGPQDRRAAISGRPVASVRPGQAIIVSRPQSPNQG